VGSWMRSGQRGVLCDRDWVHAGLRAIGNQGQGGMMEILLLGLVTVGLLGYLVYALLRPEKF
jgi:K+-transporting ATPase KdpF subunit